MLEKTTSRKARPVSDSDRGAGRVARGIADGRTVVDDVAQRGSLDEEDARQGGRGPLGVG